MKLVNDSPENTELLLILLIKAMRTKEKIPSLKLISTATSYVSIQIGEINIDTEANRIVVVLVRDYQNTKGEREVFRHESSLADIKAVIFSDTSDGQLDYTLEELSLSAT